MSNELYRRRQGESCLVEHGEGRMTSSEEKKRHFALSTKTWISMVLCASLSSFHLGLWAKEHAEKRMMELDYGDEVVVNDDGEDSIIAELHRVTSPEKLKQLSSKYKQSYASAQPFPHIVIDDIFPNSILQHVISEHPESDVGSNGCITGSAICHQQANQNLKSAVNNEESMGTYTRVFFSFLKSSIFTKFLQDISGITDLIPDPHFRGSGLHFTSTGGNLNIHADFNKYKEYELDRRVNMFIYLNDDWPEEYGGHLELWSKDMKKCYQRIKPKLGRFVAFSTTDFSYHGHPEPIEAPKGRARRSIALYFYTNGRPENECLNGNCSGKGHSTLFKKPVGCKKCLDDQCKVVDFI